MTAMKRRVFPAKTRFARLRWLSLAAAAALIPKCFLCALAYAGLGALVGFKVGGPEICGGSTWDWKCWAARLGAPLLFASGFLLAKFLRRRESNSASPTYLAQGNAAQVSGVRGFRPASPMANRTA